MQEHSEGDMILEEDDGIYEKGDILRSFHHQARRPMSQKALLAEFLSVWLKRCVVSSPSSDVILPTVLLRPFVWSTVVPLDFFLQWCVVFSGAFVH